MRVLVNLVLFLLVAAAFAWWLRPYWNRWSRAFQNLRKAFRFVRQVRDLGKNSGFPQQGGSFRTTDFSRTSNPKTVDVTAKMTIKVGCPVCREMLSEAQIEALRTSSLRCPAMQQRGVDCPYYGRSLN